MKQEVFGREHRRWAILWKTLGLEYHFRAREHTIEVPGPGCYEKRKTKDEYEFSYQPDFWLPKLETFVDVVFERPLPDHTLSAARMYAVTGYPIAIFEAPLFVPNWKTLAPGATLCRELPSPNRHYLQWDGHTFKIAPLRNEHDIICRRIQSATYHALTMVGWKDSTKRVALG